MAQLLDLANELLLDIIDVIRVEDIEAFTVCNKRIYFLSRKILQKHRAMKRKYSKVHLTSRGSHALNISLSVHPVVWLHEIMLNESAASYPTHLHIQDDNRAVSEFDRLDYPGGPLYRIVTEMKDLIDSKLEQCPYIQSKELESWKQGLNNRYNRHDVSFDRYIALLLTLLPNLQLICIKGLRGSTDCTEHVITQIAKAHQADEERTHALSHLVSLHQTCEVSTLHTAFMNLCLPFTGLPSLRSVSGNTVVGRLGRLIDLTTSRDGVEDVEGVLKTFKSGITNINFTQSDVSIPGLERLLCRIDALQDFKYEDDGERFGTFQAGRIVESLLTHAGHSLRSLDLTGKGGNAVPFGYFFMGSLRHFQVLKFIKVDNAMFIEKIQNTITHAKTSEKVHRLVDLLPASIEKIALVSILGYSLSNHIFDNLVESKAQVLPNLEEITMDYFDPIVHDLKRACREIGVELIAASTS